MQLAYSLTTLPPNLNLSSATLPMTDLLVRCQLFKSGQHTRANPRHSTSGNPSSRSMALSLNARHFARL